VEGKESEREEEEGVEVRGDEGREGEGQAPQICWPRTAPDSEVQPV